MQTCTGQLPFQKLDQHDRPWALETPASPKTKEKKGQTVSQAIQGTATTRFKALAKSAARSKNVTGLQLAASDVKNIQKQGYARDIKRVCFLAGIEFLIPVHAFYCRLCTVFSGDAKCAEKHLKTEQHFKNYQVMWGFVWIGKVCTVSILTRKRKDLNGIPGIGLS